MFKKNRDKDFISREQAEKFFSLGERFSQKIKLPERIDAINKYGQEKPQMAFFFLFLIIIASFGLGFLYPSPMYIDESVPNAVNSPTSINLGNQEAAFKKEVLDIYSEIQLITDSIETIMGKQFLTKEDSIFLNNKFLRLEQLDKVLNGQFDKQGED